MLDRLRLWYRTEKKKLLGLSRREKLSYIWTYYQLWIIGIAGFLFLTVFLTVRIATNIEGYWLYGTFANTMADAGTGSALWEDFTEYAELDLKEKKLEFNAESYFDYLKNQAKGNQYYNAFIALTDAGVLDFVTMEPESLTDLAQSGRLADLRLERFQTILERWEDRLIYFESADADQIPIGIDLSDSLLVTKYKVYSTGCALGVCAHSENLDTLVLFLRFVLEE